MYKGRGVIVLDGMFIKIKISCVPLLDSVTQLGKNNGTSLRGRYMLRFKVFDVI